MLIQVTQEDIDKGRAKAVCDCPVALAIKRATGYKWVVFGSVAQDLMCTQRVALPAYASAFIINFDLNIKGKPFEFELPLTVGQAGEVEPSN